jgi:hypothetical protein
MLSTNIFKIIPPRQNFEKSSIFQYLPNTYNVVTRFDDIFQCIPVMLYSEVNVVLAAVTYQNFDFKVKEKINNISKEIAATLT